MARQTASLSAVYDFGQVFGAEGRLRVGGGVHYVGKRPGDSANSFMLPGYTTADAFATYDTRIHGRKVKFQLNVKNLFDKTYYPRPRTPTSSPWATRARCRCSPPSSSRP